MAIPISWPSSDDVEDSYCSLDILLEQLLVTVRQVLIQRRRQQVLSSLTTRQRNTNAQSGQLHPTPTAVTVTPTTPHHPRLPLPDLVPDMDCESPRPRKTPLPPTPSPTTTSSTWAQTGAELRHIADAFRVERGMDQISVDGKSSTVTKEASLLSYLCPAMGNSLWTTLAFLLGWGLFSRSR